MRISDRKPMRITYVKKKTRKTHKWSKKDCFIVFDLTRQGLLIRDVAKKLGTTKASLEFRRRHDPYLRVALSYGRKARQNYRPNDKKSPERTLATPSFEEFVYARLDPELLPTWKRLVSEKKSQGTQTVNEILSGLETEQKQKLFIHALMTSAFRVTQAMKIVAVSNKEYDEWSRDPKFKSLLQQIQDFKFTYVQDQLMNCVRKGESWAITLAAKSFMPEQFAERKMIEHSGTIEHQAFPFEKLSLPLRKRIEQELAALNESVPDAEIVSVNTGGKQ